jgi:hypothetical protein
MNEEIGEDMTTRVENSTPSETAVFHMMMITKPPDGVFHLPFSRIGIANSKPVRIRNRKGSKWNIERE